MIEGYQRTIDLVNGVVRVSRAVQLFRDDVLGEDVEVDRLLRSVSGHLIASGKQLEILAERIDGLK